MKNPYEVLGVSKDATQKEIKSAYRRLAKKYHPDLNNGDKESEEKLKEINEAFAILGDEENRSKYDRFGDRAFDSSSGFGGFNFNMEDIFSDIFSDFFGGRQSSYKVDPNAPKKGEDIELSINISFKESVTGIEKEIKFDRYEKCDLCNGSGAKKGTHKHTCSECNGTGKVRFTQNTPFGHFSNVRQCPKCNGAGVIIEEKCEKCFGEGRIKKTVKLKVKIPEGISSGNVITTRGQGNDGENGGPRGDLYILVNVEEHELFKRFGNDIYYELPISYTTAVLGNEIDVPTLSGTRKFKIPAGTQNDTRFKLENEGIKDVRSYYKGDLYFDVKIIVPNKVTDREKELLSELADISGENIVHQKTILEKIKDWFD